MKAKTKYKGSLKLTVLGLPSGAKGSLRVTGPKKYSKNVGTSLILKNLSPGKYKVRTKAVRLAGVKYTPNFATKAVRVSKGRKRLSVKYVAAGGGSGGAPTTPRPPSPIADTTVRWLPSERTRVVCQSVGVPAANELRFGLCDKEGISITAGGRSRTAAEGDANASNLRAVQSNGSLVNAVVSGSVTAQLVQVGPTGKTYISLATPVNLNDTTSATDQCAFIEVNEATGVPTCVDKTVRNVTSVKFDNGANVYYFGRSPDNRTVLRKWDGASIRSLITNEASLSGFAVMADGYVVLTGSTGVTGSGWTRLIAPTGSLSNIFAGNRAQFISLYPDGNVYMGMWDGDQFGIRRLLAANKSLDPAYWTGAAINNLPEPTSYFPVRDYCTPRIDAFCGWFGSHVSSTVITQDGKVLVLAGAPGLAQVLMQYWPSVKYLNTSISRVTVMTPAGGIMFIAGSNAAGENVAALYDPKTDTERVVIGAGNQIEIYNASYSAAVHKVFFDGLRFSDNQRVIGEIDASSGEVTVLGVNPDSLTDLQAF